MRQANWLIVFIAATVAGCQSLAPATKPTTSLVNIVEQFSLPDLGGSWSFRTPNIWHLSKEDGQNYLPLAPFSPESQRAGWPNEYALYNKLLFHGFSLSCRVRMDRESARAGRDICVAFARVDASHFYCVQLADTSSGLLTGIYRIDGGQIHSLLPLFTQPPKIDPGSIWHKLDILHDAEKGTIQVYWDAYDPSRIEPLMQATDRTYQRGYIALGSVAHPARFARLILQGQAERAASTVREIK